MRIDLLPHFRLRPRLGLGALCLTLGLTLASGCRGNDNGEAEVVIDVGNAEPQSTPIPTGDADPIQAPQIVSLDAPDEVRPGQIVTLRITTNYSPYTDIAGAAIIVEGVDNWLKAQVVPEPAAASDEGAWLVYLPITIAGTADANDLTRIEVALLGPNDKAGTYLEWEPKIDASGDVVECPLDGDCTDIACGLDPLCATVCGSCPLDLACNANNVCEGIGDACPEAALCGTQECGADPVCGEPCGVCDPGFTCNAFNSCEVDPEDPGPSAVQIVAGSDHVCALFDGGAVKCWGSHSQGQLGLGNTDGHGDQVDEMGPGLPTVPVTASDSVTVTALSAGTDHTCALLDDGSVKCWGSNGKGQLGIGDWKNRGDDDEELGDALPSVNLAFEAASICAGNTFTCARSTEGAVKCWGDNQYGQLGQGDATNRGGSGDTLGDTLPAIDLGGSADAISCNARHACATLASGDLKCWGYNLDGQLGLGDTAHRGDEAGEMGGNLPAVDLDGDPSGVVTRASHSCALVGGDIKCWGDNDTGGLGLGDDAPRGAASGTMGASLPAVDLGSLDPVEVAVGYGHSCARDSAGTVKCWGFNGGGALGLGDTLARGDQAGEMGNSLETVDLGTDFAVSSLALGNGFSCALSDQGLVKCWGTNAKGQLGLEDTNDRGNAPGEMGDELPLVDLW